MSQIWLKMPIQVPKSYFWGVLTPKYYFFIIDNDDDDDDDEGRINFSVALRTCKNKPKQ